MTSHFLRRGTAASALCAVALLTACAPGEGFDFGAALQRNQATTGAAQSIQLIERDVEAPEVFQITANGLWDGRPSLGGVWVAHPDVIEPERVIIRNQENGKFVIGALFRRERSTPGPALQVSSDAAAAIDLFAGAPTQLNVTALRREQVAVEEPEATTDFDSPRDIEETTLGNTLAGAAAAIDAAETSMALPDGEPRPIARPSGLAAPEEATSVAPPAPEAETVTQPTPPTEQPTTALSNGPLEKPFIQTGIFNIEENAIRTADMMRESGIIPTILEQTSQGRTFWRLIVGPANSARERSALLEQVRAKGFADAYYVTN